MAQLQRDQEDLLLQIVDAYRRQPSGEKRVFVTARFGRDSVLRHPQLGQLAVHPPDIEILIGYGLLHLDRFNNTGGANFDVTPDGVEYAAAILNARGAPADQQRSVVEAFAASGAFANAYPAVADRLAEANRLLLEDVDGRNATQIGHLVREAMIGFAVEWSRAAGGRSDSRPERTLDHVRAGLDALADRVPGSLYSVLEAQWGTVSDFAQRQEHGASKEGEPLQWEDGRVAVYQAINVMFELDRALRR
jgi:hypothetical protein